MVLKKIQRKIGEISPIIPSKRLIKSNIKMGKEHLRDLKRLAGKLKKGERVRFYRMWKTGGYLFPQLKDVEEEIKFYERVRLPKLRKRLKEMT